MMEVVEEVTSFVQEESMMSGGGLSLDGTLPPDQGGIQGGDESLSPDGGAQANIIVIETRTLLWTKWYYYNDDGNVTRVVRNPGEALGQTGSNSYSATRMVYAKNQRTVAYAVGEKWDITGTNPPRLTGYAMTYAFQYRYDGSRQRYLNRELKLPSPWTTSSVNVLSDTWTDYDGDQPYGDFEVVDERTAPWDPPLWVTHELRSFDLAMGSFAWTSDSPDTNGPPPRFENHALALHQGKSLFGGHS